MRTISGKWWPFGDTTLPWVRRGRISFVLGGVAWLIAALPSVLLTVGYNSVLPDLVIYAMYDYREQVAMLEGFLRVFGALLVGVGFAGLYALLTIRLERRSRLATVGLALILLAVLCELALLAQPRAGVVVYEPDWGALFSIFAVAAYLGGPAGVVLLGLVALKARGLGAWKVLPLALGLLGSPLPSVLLFSLYPMISFGGSQGDYVLLFLAVLFQAPQLLVGLGCVLLGNLMARPGSKELVSRREENLALASRLYEVAWGRGELGDLDELVAPGVVDHYHGGLRGIEHLKRNVSNLRVSFPDLRFVLEGQEAEGDLVTTRWTASGTDLGGVLWYPPTGKAAAFSGTFTDRFEEGRLVEHWGESDTPGLLRRLGLPPKG